MARNRDRAQVPNEATGADRSVADSGRSPAVPKRPGKQAIRRPCGVTEALKVTAQQRRTLHRNLAEIERHAPARRNDLLPRLATTLIACDRLRPAHRRVRKPSPAQIARVQASIETFGICQPVLVDRDYRIVHGHTVLEAARKMGLAEIP